MVLDLIGVTLLIAFFIQGYRKGIIVALFSFLGIVLGVLCALKLSEKFAGYLFQQGWVTSAWAQIVSYILLFAGVAWIVRLGGKFIQKTFETMMLGLPNRLIGGAIYGLIGAFIWSACLWLGNQIHMLAPETIVASKTYNWFVPVAPWVFDHVGDVLPFAKSIFSDLKSFFDGVNQHLPDHVGAH